MPLCALFLRSSQPTGVLICCVIGLCAGIYLFVHGFILFQRRRLILDTPFSKIRSASLGMVEVSGLAAGPYTMVAPITAKPCYYHRTLVWEWKQHGKNKEWVKVAGECVHLPFFLDDNTGRVLVDPRGADLDMHCDFQQEFCDSFFTTKDPAPPNVRSFLARHGVVTNNKIKVEEHCIKPKNALFILGTLAENPGLEVTSQPIRETVNLGSIHSFSLKMNSSFSVSVGAAGPSFDATSFAQRLASDQAASETPTPSPHVIHLSIKTGPDRSVDMTQQQKIAAALLKAGISNPAAWSAAGVEGETVEQNASVVVNQSFADGPDFKAADSATNGDNGFDLHPPVVLMKGTNNKTFLISWQSQQAVARSLGWKCALMIWGGPALALLSLYVLLNIGHVL